MTTEDNRKPTPQDLKKAIELHGGRASFQCSVEDAEIAAVIARERRETWKRAIEAAASVAGTKWQVVGQSVEAQNIERWIRELEDPAESAP